MIKLYCLIFFIFTFFSVADNLSDSKTSFNWAFGIGGGLTFNTKSGVPKPVLHSPITQLEGCASISNDMGEFLFYSDGINVWNRVDSVMENGTNLKGHRSSTQSAMILPYPGKPDLYYIITSDSYESLGESGYCYSLVDISQNNGLGKVILKNISLYKPCTEKLSATLNKDRKSIWLITHEWNSNRFFTYLISDTGISAVPVISSIGTNHLSKVGLTWVPSSRGAMKISPNGKKLAVANLFTATLEVFDFNNSTGVVSNPVQFSGKEFKDIYGIEFSPDNSKVYFTSWDGESGLYQVDLSSNDSSEMKLSLKLVAYSQTEYFFGTIQLAPDGRIYMAKNESHNLGVIKYPDRVSPYCDFFANEIFLGGGISQLGLPNFISSIFDSESGIKSNSPVCEGDSLYLFTTAKFYDSLVWKGPGNFTSKSRQVGIPNVQIGMSGTYYLYIYRFDGTIDTLSTNVKVNYIRYSLTEFEPDKFKDICVPDSIGLSFVINNEGADIIDISDIYLNNSNNCFYLNDTTYKSNLIFPGGNRKISVFFKPKYYQIYADTLKIEFVFPCYGSINIPLTGNGSMKSLIHIPVNTAIAGQDSFCIGISYRKTCGTPNPVNLGFFLRIKLHKSFIYPDTALMKYLTCTYIRDDYRYIEFDGDARFISFNEYNLTDLCGLILLPDMNSTDIVIDTFYWKHPFMYADLENGRLNVTNVCKTESRRIQRFNLPELEITNSVSSSQGMIINLTTYNPGTFDIRIFNLIGIEVSHFTGVNSTEGRFVNRFNQDINNYSNGIYYAICNYNGLILKQKILIER